MSGATVADLLADLIGPAQSEWSGRTPAKVANPAKNRASIDAAGASGACEGLRKVANSQANLTPTAPDSQKFAALRSGCNQPQSEHPCGFSQDSQDSQGVPRANGPAQPAYRPKAGNVAPLQTVADRGAVATVTTHAMVAARLATLPDGVRADRQGASIEAPTQADAAALLSVSRSAVQRAREVINDAPAQASLSEEFLRGCRRSRPHKLAPTEADAAHAEPWNDAACARFVARVALFLRRGINATDADDLAERLHLRDVQGGDRVLCVECRLLVGGAGAWRCGNARVAGVGADLPAALVMLPQRCAGFVGGSAMSEPNLRLIPWGRQLSEGEQA